MKRITILWMVLLLILGSLTSVEAASSQIVFQGPTNSKVIALTFDDGADGTNIEEILRILEAQQIKATFFLTGGGTNHHPEKIRRIVSKGHEIGNHSFSHPDFRELTFDQMYNELKKAETAIKNATGVNPSKIFRAPFGAYNSHVLEGVGRAGYPYTIQWTIDTIDWRGDSANTIYNRVINNAKPGAIVLMHTGQGASGTVEALPKMIHELKRQGYGFVTVSKLLNISGTTPKPVEPKPVEPKPVEPKPEEPKLPTEYYYYVVQPGDTLYSISREVGVSTTEISYLNKITDPNRIFVGQRLIIPGKEPVVEPKPIEPKPIEPKPIEPKPVVEPKLPDEYYYYVVKTGDTLSGISQKLGVSTRELIDLNKITNPDRLYIGQRLIIPGEETSMEPVKETAKEPVKEKTSVVLSTKIDRIGEGENLYDFAKRHQLEVEEILRHNLYKNPALYRVGQPVTVPVKTTTRVTQVYVFRIGDSLTSVAKSHGLSVEELLQINNWKQSTPLRPGKVMKL